jgi:hypothetical protein
VPFFICQNLCLSGIEKKGFLREASFLLVSVLERFFGSAAKGAGVIGGDIFPLGSGGYAVVGVARGFVVYITAYRANVIHNLPPFRFYIMP